MKKINNVFYISQWVFKDRKILRVGSWILLRLAGIILSKLNHYHHLSPSKPNYTVKFSKPYWIQQFIFTGFGREEPASCVPLQQAGSVPHVGGLGRGPQHWLSARTSANPQLLQTRKSATVKSWKLELNNFYLNFWPIYTLLSCATQTSVCFRICKSIRLLTHVQHIQYLPELNLSKQTTVCCLEIRIVWAGVTRYLGQTNVTVLRRLRELNVYNNASHC